MGRGGRVVYAEPQQPRQLGGHPAPALRHEVPASLRGADGSLVEVLGRLGCPCERVGALGHASEGGPHVGESAARHVELGAFVVAAHGGKYLVERQLLWRSDKQRHPVGEVVSLRIVQILSSPVSPHNRAEKAPHAGLAKARAFEAHGVVSVRKGEGGVGRHLGIEAVLLGEGDGVGGEERVVVGGEGGDACLVRVRRDVARGHLFGHPHRAQLELALADYLHYPGLGGVRDGEALALRDIPVLRQKRADGGDGLSCSLRSLQGYPDERSIINQPLALHLQLRDAAVSGFSDYQAKLIHIPDNVEGLRRLLDLPQVHACVPVIHVPHRARCVRCSGVMI
mmetsp:Transcript_28364/g.62833  ORF Transcript_28364/g.62833 Transcript_28364/m.62833 type:complete len:339 (+) Transcript_28364:901-1917(+)